MSSREANVLTSTSSVVRGRWKFVNRQSTAWKENPGRMKRSVGPDQAETVPERAAVSSVRIAVVPTATTRPPRAFVARIAAAVGSGQAHHSVCIGWSSSRSAVIGRNVSMPTCSVTSARPMPRAATAASRSGVKCSPAVGAAAEPAARANTV